MIVKTLYKSGALGAGSQLWICPELSQSYWTKSIDWYLNFQLSRSKSHQLEKRSADLENLLEKFEAPEFNFTLPKNSATILACQGCLPSEQLIEVPQLEDPDEWLQFAHAKWVSLNKPSLRLFLPNFLPVTDLEVKWPSRAEEYELTVVPSLYEEQ